MTIRSETAHRPEQENTHRMLPTLLHEKARANVSQQSRFFAAQGEHRVHFLSLAAVSISLLQRISAWEPTGMPSAAHSSAVRARDSPAICGGGNARNCATASSAIDVRRAVISSLVRRAVISSLVRRAVISSLTFFTTRCLCFRFSLSS